MEDRIYQITMFILLLNIKRTGVEDLNFASLKKQILSYNPSGDLSLIQKAYEFANKADGQHRVSGELLYSTP